MSQYFLRALAVHKHPSPSVSRFPEILHSSTKTASDPARKEAEGRMRLVALWAPLTIALSVMCVDGASQVTLNENGYEGIVIAISRQVDERDGVTIINTLKKLVTDTSRRLFNATRRRAYFRNVTILIPQSWSEDLADDTAFSENMQDSEIRVDTAHSVYGNQPYTEQPGLCGQPGHFIHLTPEFLVNERKASSYGNRGINLLKEWAKLRWGVFDEAGYEGDGDFPLFYPEDEDGQKYLPTLCANKPIKGEVVTKNPYKSCEYGPDGKPAEDCIFRPDPNEEQQTSFSPLSYPMISIFNDPVVDFCDDESSQQPHNKKALTRQNTMCNGQSVWEVMQKHEDFANDANPPTNTYTDPNIRVVQQTDANYALVLDYSGSMANRDRNSRIDLVKKAARRWLLYEVADGSRVAIVRFSGTATLLRKLTKISDEASRRRLAESLEVIPNGGTSIGSGLELAIGQEVLEGVRNPVVLVLTDGVENADPKIAEVLQKVIQSRVRVITVAFGSSADKNLEVLAKETGGKSFIVNDDDEGFMLDDAFVAALTYQPPPSVIDTTVVIYEGSFSNSESNVGGSFQIDFTIGRNLILECDSQNKTHVLEGPYLTRPNGTRVVGDAEFDPDIIMWKITIPMAEEGEWKWQAKLSNDAHTRIRVKVAAQTRDSAVLPITASAMISTGSKDVDTTIDRPVIYAKVKQGNNPVINATVRAVVTPPNNNVPDRVFDLLDNGKGADTTAGDGIYSRYMTKYAGTGRYSVKAHVSSDGKAVIIGGGSVMSGRRRRSAPHSEKRPKFCCGSVIPVNPDDIQEAGRFKRLAQGGSFQVVQALDIDTIPPDRVRDFRVVLKGSAQQSDKSYNLLLTWTAPGDDLDAGTVSNYSVRLSSNHTEVMVEGVAQATGDLVLFSIRDFAAEEEVFLEAGEEVSVNVTSDIDFDSSDVYYLTLQAIDKAGLKGPISNVVAISVHRQETPEPASPFMSVWKIVIISVSVSSIVISTVGKKMYA